MKRLRKHEQFITGTYFLLLSLRPKSHAHISYALEYLPAHTNHHKLR